MKKLTTLLLSLGIAGGLNAALVITDGGFEDGEQSIAGGAAFLRLNQWFELNEPGSGTSGSSDEGVEVMEQEGGTNNPTDTVGAYWLNLKTNTADSTFRNGSPYEAAAYQSIGTWNTGDATTVSFSMNVGDRGNQNFAGFQLSLFSGTPGTGADDADLSGVTLLDETSYLNAATFGFTDTSGTINSTSYTTANLDISGAADGDTIWLYLSANRTDGGSGHTLIDNIAVVPEPSTYALYGGLMALGLVMLRRRLRS
jgi:hypothetical protein